MKIARWIILTLLLIGLAACAGGGITLLPGPTKTSSLPTAQVTVIPAPDANSALRGFLDAQGKSDYPTMYAMLSKASQAAISQADFASHYTDALNKMSAGSTAYNILSTLTHPQSAQAAFHVVYHTALFGDIARDMTVNLILEDGGWKLQWDDGLILPELAGGKKLVAKHVPPSRGDIYDSSGNAIVTQADADAIGLVAGEAPSDKEGALMSALYRLTGIRPEIIRSAYDNTNSGDYVPVGEASADAVSKSGIGNYSGVTLNPYTSRYYEPNAAPHAVGYTLYISKENVDQYMRLGYNGTERVGF
jgi:penicillin-binding protein 2